MGVILHSWLSIRQTYLLVNSNPGRYSLKQHPGNFISYKIERKSDTSKISTFEMKVHPNNCNSAMKLLLIQEHLVDLKCANSIVKLHEMRFSEMSWDLGMESHSLLTLWESHSAYLVSQTWKCPVLGIQVWKWSFYSKWYFFQNQRKNTYAYVCSLHLFVFPWIHFFKSENYREVPSWGWMLSYY